MRALAAGVVKPAPHSIRSVLVRNHRGSIVVEKPDRLLLAARLEPVAELLELVAPRPKSAHGVERRDRFAEVFARLRAPVKIDKLVVSDPA